MRKISVIFIIFFSILTISQSELKKSGTTIQEIIPNNWVILDTIFGDLNQDGISDLVFAIQNTDKENFELSDGGRLDSIDLNQRVFGIYFGTKSGLLEQKLISKDFIILRDSPTMDEPFEGFEINNKGVLEIKFRFWYSGGSWIMSNHRYNFQFKNNEFVLTGYNSSKSNRASGETIEYNINFLDREIKIVKGNFSIDNPKSIESKKFNLESPFTIKKIGKPFELDFEGIKI